MKARRLLLALVTTLFATSGTVSADSAVPPAPAAGVGMKQDPARLNALARQVEQLGERLVRDANVTGLSVSMVHGDQVLLERGFGVTDVRSRERVGSDTVFRLASLSKAFAGTLAALLVEEGALRWDTRVADHLPAFALKNIDAAQALTAQDILSHRVGLGYHTYDRQLEADEPYPLLVAKLGTAPMLCSSGDCYAYQNIAFSLIGDLTFAVTGDFYTHQVEKRIFHPLGMFDATFGREALEASASWARPHVMRGGRWTALRPKENYYRVPPAAGVNASARDLSQWLIGQLGKRPDVLSPELLEEIRTPQVETPSEIRSVPWRSERIEEAHYALGWRVYRYAGETMVFHAGAVQGYRGMIGFLPDHDFGFAVLWNCECRGPGALLPTVMDRFLELPRRDWLELHRY